MRIFFIIILIIYPYYLNSKVINLKYEIDWQSIHLADLNWIIKIDDNRYDINFIIRSYGLTNKIYNYESVTNISGFIENNHLRPEIYDSKTKSSKQNRFEKINFNKNGSITKIEISKKLNNDQTELQKNIIQKYKYFTDPISQLVQYFLFQNNSDRIILDGLNIYELLLNMQKDEILDDNNTTIHNGNVKLYDLTFPFFEGLHKIDKKNNINKISTYYFENEFLDIPAKFHINSKKFNANLYLKSFDITH